MLAEASIPDVLADIDFIQEHYKEYFSVLDVLEKTDSRVVFRVNSAAQPSRSVTVELSRRFYRVLGDTQEESRIVGAMFESFEQVLSAIMGESSFTDHLMQLVVGKLLSDDKV